jgi:hypothetical protein
MNSGDIPRQGCWKCGYMMDKTTDARNAPEAPREGDVSICWGCGTLGIFTKDLTIRKPTLDEKIRLEADPFITEVQIQRAYMIGDRLRWPR